MLKKMRKKLALSIMLTCFLASYSFANNSDNLLLPNKDFQINNQKQNSQIRFSIANLVDNFLNSDTKIQDNTLGDKSNLRKNFLATTSKFNQGNALVAYDEYDKFIDEIDNDTSLLSLAKVFYEIGFFSLANKSVEKIIYKNQYYDNIVDLEKCYKPAVLLSKEDEIYYAKLYSQIYFDNSAPEVITELNKKYLPKEKNDYINFYLARANYETKNYNLALNFINKAVSINPENLNYQMLKIDILKANKKYRDAYKLLSKIKNQKNLFNFSDKVRIEEQKVLANITNNDKEKKFHTAYAIFLEGNYEKTKKDCQSILNFDKDNDKILTLYAKSELASGNIERANSFFVNSYKEEKNNLETLIGLGDIRFIHGDYKNSVKMYKKAYAKDKTNYETIIKLANAQRQYGKYPKELKKLENLMDKMPKKDFSAYYAAAMTIAQKNLVLKEDYLKRALNINPLHEKTIGALVELHLKNKNFELARNLIYNASFTLEKNYYYYYLCGLYNQAINKKGEAIRFYKTSLSLNPNFEIANVKLLKLIPDDVNEEI